MELTEAVSVDLEQRFIDGDERALREIYDHWGGLVFGYCRRKLANASDAEEVAQQVFVSAWRSRERFEPSRGSLASWLMGIARFKIVDRHRSLAKKHETTIDSIGEPAEGDRTDMLADRLLVASAISKLSPDQRRIVEMAFWQGYSHQEIAERLGLPLGTVKSHIRRGLDRLRRQIGGEQ